MKVKNFNISEEVINKAIGILKKQRSFTALELNNELEKLGVPKYIGIDYISIIAASRIIQKLKKGKLIKNTYGGGANTIWKFIK